MEKTHELSVAPVAALTDAACRFCGAPLHYTFVDLGMSPLCESYLSAEQLNQMEPFYPLHVYVCSECFLVQLEEYVTPEEIFPEYAYFSSYATSWLAHAKRYTDLMVERFGYGADSFVVEVASNDGYLLQYFVEKGIPCLGIEPARNVAEVAEKAGRPDPGRVLRRRPGDAAGGGRQAGGPAAGQQRAGPGAGPQRLRRRPEDPAQAGRRHHHRVPAPDEADGARTSSTPSTTSTSPIFCFIAAEKIFAAHGLRLFDVEELPTHGGSLRIYACHDDDDASRVSDRATELREREIARRPGPDRAPTPPSPSRSRRPSASSCDFLIEARRAGQAGRRLRRAGQGQHAAQLLRHPHRLPRLHGRPQPLQAGQVPARDPHSDPSPRAHPRDEAGLRAHPALELQGRDHGADGLHS